MEAVKVETFNDYQQAAMRTCTGSSRNARYMAMGLVSEAGEVAGKLAKVIRDDGDAMSEEKRQLALAECGDVCWFIAGVCAINGAMLGDVMRDYPDIESFDDYAAFEARSPYSNDRMCLMMCENAVVVAKCALFSQRTEVMKPYIIRLMQDTAVLAHKLGSTMREVLEHNVAKLAKRYNTNTLHGSGDRREEEV